MAEMNHGYEDFDPTIEWQQDDGHDTLLVYLPGFGKEQIKVQVTSNRKLRIFGERSRLVDNKRSRFSKEIQIPAKYETEKITAKFEGGILKIKHPKISILAPPPPPPPPPKPQENQEKTAQELQKAKNELKDSKNENEKVVQENQELQNPKKELQDAKNGKEKAVQENQELQNPKKELKDEKNDKEKAGEAIPSKKTKENSATEKKSNGKEKETRNEVEKNSKLKHYKQFFGGFVTEIKKPRKSTNMIVATGLFVLLIGFCIKSAIKSQESEN